MQLMKLQTKFLGRNNIYFNKIDSTQDEIWRLIQENKAPNGTLVMADIQTKAKGTHGRNWYTDEKNNIAFSFFIKMECELNKLEEITIKIANIIINIFRIKYKINLKIKQPNDIMFNGKKIGGILTQTKVNAGIVKYLVVGIGINTAQEEFCEDIKYIATSIKKEFNIDVNVEEFITEFCNVFEKEMLKIVEI